MICVIFVDIWIHYVTCGVSKGVNMGVDLDTRIGILGPNGAGKSTFINCMLQKLRPTKGDVYHNPHMRVAVFTQVGGCGWVR